MRGGIRVTLMGQALRFALQMVGIFLLSRLLAPSDFGVLAMVMAVVGVASVLGDMGLSLAAVQAPELSDSERTALFWLNTFIGIFIAGVVFASAPLVSSFYASEVVAPVAASLSVVFLANGVQAQFRAEANRRLRFVWMAAADVLSQAVGLVLAISLALSGARYWALVWQQIGIAFTSLAICALAAGWLPGRFRSLRGLSSHMKFGAAASGTQVLNYVTTNLPTVVIGRLYDAVQVGFFSRSFQLFSLPLQQIGPPLTRVALPFLARSENSEVFVVRVLRLMRLMSLLLLPVLALVAGVSGPLVRLALGDQWVDASALLSVLTIGGAFQALGYGYYWAFLARAEMSRLLLCELIGRAVMMILVLLLANISVLAVTSAYSAGLFAIWLAVTMLGIQRLGIGRLPAVLNTIPSLILSSVIYVASATVVFAMRVDQPLLQLVVACFSAVCVFLLAMVVPSLRRDFIDLLEIAGIGGRK